MNSLIVAAVLDLLIGDPYYFPHPVKLMGRIIGIEERIARKLTRSKGGLKLAGFIIVILNVFLAYFIPYTILKVLLPYKIAYNLLNIYLMYTCIAARCLDVEAMKVYNGIEEGLEEGRKRLSYIVGRDTTNLTFEEIIRADVETVAENTSDGVIAPLFYMMLLGAPGGLAYKMTNTMDSMLGYKNEKYIDYGYFPAKTDDLFNFLPARLTGILMILSSAFKFDIKKGFQMMVRDRKNHKSPNCAYPEGAVAGLLNIQLGGNNYYFGKMVEKPTIGDKTISIDKSHIRDTVEIMYRSEFLFLFLYTLIKIFYNS
ncbi:adenosylcobinamide-phosphate synthase CbiB [Tissierella sp. MSJ-40]|uniref:Cobalamin biosynthesis protein CobD n=1 Tax=Tissierella simiarum TaxID=2841534 RepID=A0ABS6E5B4_9FIRM|nr:adenosylcobinamide-phosphate synthase CbiB [Tissierella simiarum]MBU5437438.1 adenosylcobinamide-phosphate synthase CbiB [Tissierella simiarum]